MTRAIFPAEQTVINKRSLRNALLHPVQALENYASKRIADKYVEIRTKRSKSAVKIIEQGFIAPNFPIDIVYTWVDQESSEFQALLAEHLPNGGGTTKAVSDARFHSHDELRYSLRSIEQFAPWCNHIYIVTNGQVPSWLRPSERISIVPHSAIIDPAYLPTFNSHVIESCLHRIPGLSEHYMYFNDDVLLLHPIKPTDAFTENGLAYGFITSNTVSNGPPQARETATEWGAKNARDLILREWGVYFDRRFSHMYLSQIRSVADLCESRFADAYHAFRQNRFRNPADVLCTGFLHQYAGFLSGRYLFVHDKCWYVKVRDASAIGRYRKILAARTDPGARAVACLNDYIPPYGEMPGYQEHLRAFLETYYPVPSSFEVESGAREPRARLMAV